MKWVAISGSWRKTNSEIESAVREAVKKIVLVGDGIVTGGALNVDFFATDEAMKWDKKCERIKICLPTSLDIYAKHYRKRAEEGVITTKQAEELIALLENVKKLNSAALIENMQNQIVNKGTYFARNQAVIDQADSLIAFQVNDSEGVADTVEKAKKKGISVKLFKFQIDK